MTPVVKRALASTGLLPAVRRVRRSIWLATDPSIRAQAREHRARFAAFRERYAAVLAPPPPGGRGAATKTALLNGTGYPTLETELTLLVVLRHAGFRPVVLLQDRWRVLRRYYELAGATVHCWSEFDASSSGDLDAARAAIAGCRSSADVAALTQDGIRVGQAATVTALRRHRVGAFEWRHDEERARLSACVEQSVAVAAQSTRMLAAIRPDIALFWDAEYTPSAELFDACIAHGVDAVSYRTSHQTNGLLFKRYTAANRDDQPGSLSDATWAAMQARPWSADIRDTVDREIATSYARGDWFKECWTQSQAGRVAPGAVRAQLGLDPAKRTAVIFSHILWDAPLSWGAPLFATYEDWLVETARVAYANDRLNWVIKIHPAHVGKAAREGYAGEPAELAVLRARLGPPPPHVVVMPPETPINALSVFDVMDYCLTVRGTVGVEAARLGIPVITAAVNRYSDRGFTVDSKSPAEYLARLAVLETVPRLTAASRELAERFAYGLLVRRPFVFESVTWDYGTLGQPTRGRIHVPSAEAWAGAGDVRALAHWFGASRDEDLLAWTSP